MDISGLIKVLRLAARMKQHELAAKAGITQNYLSMIEGGRRRPGTEVLERISDALGVPLPFLIMYRSGVPQNVGQGEAELLETLRQLCLDFLKLKLGLESPRREIPQSAEHQKT